jgi:hypothetical protein
VAPIRDVIHHVADEETIVVSVAEKKLRDARRPGFPHHAAPRSTRRSLDMGRAVSGNTAALAFAAAAAVCVVIIGRGRGSRSNGAFHG